MFFLRSIASFAGYLLSCWKYQKFLQMIYSVYLLVIFILGLRELLSKLGGYISHLTSLRMRLSRFRVESF
jgi:hypothetical protein